MNHQTLFRTVDLHRGATAARLLLVLAATVSAVLAQTNAQWRGSSRDGIYPGEGLASSWPQGGPPLVMTIDGLGAGHSSPAVTNDRIFITGKDIDNTGYLHAFDHSGKRLWKRAYGPEWSSSYPGARSSPTVAGDRIYLVSGQGRVVCLETATGKEVWSVDMVSSFGARMPTWGFNESVLLAGDRIICTPGGPQVSVAALDRAKGKTIWKSAGSPEGSAYCSPLLVHHGGRDIVVTMLAGSIRGFDLADGKLLWSEPHPTDHGVNANTPIYHNGTIIYSSGYGEGTAALKLSVDGRSATKLWSNSQLDSQMGGIVVLGNLLFGPSHRSPGFHALDVTSGTTRYSSTVFGRGVVIAAADLLYVYNDRGTVSLVKPEADDFTVAGTLSITGGSGQHWPHPVIAGTRLYVRRGSALMVYAIGK